MGFLQIVNIALEMGYNIIFFSVDMEKGSSLQKWAQTLLLLSLSEAVENPASAKLAQELGFNSSLSDAGKPASAKMEWRKKHWD